ncbi:hypothetical protein [Noviherbaspirillum saxi]|uniref:Transposase n=1 Tax=Noviherbaspirillum saxi TaxID=2320863 RepID=A0A3A3FN41_9BURK|nr:hypothetical protein D3871_21225 [Noviherbaspirillum saxi]
MKKIPKEAYTTGFNELVVKRVTDGESITAAAKELGLGNRRCATGSTLQKEASSKVPVPKW